MIELFQGITITRPSEQVVTQIRRLIAKGALKPGDMLPPERSLSEKLGISRGHVRAGIKTLELYGFVKSTQGRGTVVSDLGMKSLNGILGDLLNLLPEDVLAFLDTRILLETHAAALAAGKRTGEDLDGMREIIGKMREIGGDTDRWLELDFGLHLKIAESSHNPVLAGLIKFMTPNIVSYYHKFFRDRVTVTLPIHIQIVDAIVERDAETASAIMNRHLHDGMREFLDVSDEPKTKKRTGTRGVTAKLKAKYGNV
jgi:GntR family transcriptional repressor for pyruvate dehydrogenase complex